MTTTTLILAALLAPSVPFAPGAHHVECTMDGVDFGGQNDQEYFAYANESRLLNGGFESAARYWRSNNGGFDIRACICEDDAHSGRRSLNAKGAGAQCHGLALKPGKYTLAFWCKNAPGERRSSVTVTLWSFNGRKGDVHGKKCPNRRFPCTDKWTRQVWTFDWNETAFTFSVSGGLIDDIQLCPAGLEANEVVNPYGLELKTTDGLGRTYCDIAKPFSVALDFRAPNGAKGTMDIEVTDFFRRTLKTLKDVPYAGSREVPLYAKGAFAARGVFVVRVHVKPAEGRDFVDHLRFAAYRFADGTAKNRMLHQIPANAADHLKTEYYRQMKSLGVVPRDNSVVRTVPPEWLPNAKKPPYWYRPWETMPERARSVAEQGGTMKYGWTMNRTTGRFLEEAGVTNVARYAAIDAAVAEKIEAAVEKTVRLFPWVEVWCSPNEVSGHWTTVKTGKLEDYARALIAMERGVRKANPQAVFLAYSTCNLGEQGRREIFDCFAAAQRVEPGHLFPAVDVHPYRAHPDDPDLDGDIDVFTGMLARLGYGRSFQIHGLEGCYYFPFIMDEWNHIAPWAGTSQKDRFSSFGTPGYSLGWGERIATAMMLRDKLIVYKHADQVKGATAWGVNMLDAQTVMAPFVATAAQTELLGNATFLEDVRFAPNCRAYVFDDHAGHAVAAYWKADVGYDRGRREGVTMELKGLDGVEIFDLMGNQVREAVARGASDAPASGNAAECRGAARSASREDGMALPLTGFPVYLRVRSAKRKALVEALNACVIPGLGESPVGFEFKMKDLREMSVTAENALTRPFRGTCAFADGQEHALELAPRASETLSYAFERPLQFGAINKVTVPMTVKSSVGTVTNAYRFNVLPVPYAKEIPDWSKLPLIDLEYRAPEVFALSRGDLFGGKDDLSGGFKIAWNEEHLYIHFEITDDKFAVKLWDDNPSLWWSNDSFQLFFDTFGDGPMKKIRGVTGFDGNDMSYDVMPTNETGAVVFRRHAPDHQLTGGVLGGLKRNQVEPGVSCSHRYDPARHLRLVDLDFPARLLRPMRLEEGSVPGFAVKVYDRDDPEAGNRKNGGAKGFLTNVDPKLGSAFGTMHEYAMLLFVREGN